METLPLGITGLFAGIHFIGTLILAILVVRMRNVTKTPIGDGDKKPMIRAIRAHNNNLENVPIAIILMAIIELNGGSAVFLYITGGLLTLARILHPVGLYQTTSRSFGRFWGTSLTWLIILAFSCYAIFLSLFQ